jgi:virginiamycin A acetyltransferase
MSKPAGSRQLLKRVIDTMCMVLVAPCAWSCALDGRNSEAIFAWWAQLFAIVPGLPGVFVRRAFYRLTLENSSGSFFIAFGAIFSHRRTTIEDGVYVGAYTIVGAAMLRRGCLIGSRAGIISGSALHDLDASGRRKPTDLSQLRQVEIGEDAWIGEGALVMADVGRRATVAAGSVVSSAVLGGVVVAGNPARFIRHITTSADQDEGRVSAAM